MSTINDGGPAFPQENRINGLGGYDIGHPGMTLRDYFAAKIAGGDLSDGDLSINATDEMILARIRLYYRIADAMLAARAQDSEGAAKQ